MMLGLGLGAMILLVGVLIGGVGVGGVLLVPSLTYLGQFPLKEAIPSSMLAYLSTGIVGTIMYARMGSINWHQLIRVVAGALPGAFLGAWLLPLVPGLLLEVAIGLLVMLSGIHALFRKTGNESLGYQCGGGTLVLTGFLVGTGSALTGTGGPLLLIPVLMWMNMPIFAAVGLAQAVQIPIALSATSGNLAYGDVNIMLGLVIGAILAVGAIAGARIIHYFPKDQVTKIVAGFLVAVGFSILARLLLA